MVRPSRRKDIIRDVNDCLQLYSMFKVLQDIDSSSSSEDDMECSGLDSDDSSNSDSEDFMGEFEDSMTNLDTTDSDSSDDDEVGTLLHCFSAAINNSRYVSDRVNAIRSSEYKYDFFLQQSDEDFRIMTRLTKELFHFLVDIISPDPVFQNRSRNKQAPIHWQLACALDRLGNDGQGVSAGRSKHIWGLGHGTVFSYYSRVVEALFNLRNDFIVWPDRDERQQISARNEELGFKGAVGFVDGTTFPLHQKPSFHGNEYMDRKKRYSVNAQIVCDDCHQITHMLTGMTGAAHDSRMFSQSGLVQNPQQHFCTDQYLLADSAYAASAFLVPAYKDRQKDTNAPNEGRLIEIFNTFLAQARVVNEHTIGILKSRWTSLRGLRINLRDQNDVYKIMKHTIVCAVLHNIALNRDPWDEDILLDVEQPTDDLVEDPGQRNGRRTVGQQKRFRVRMACLRHHGVNQ